MRNLFILLILCFGLTSAHAQKMSWRKHAKLAEKQYEAGEFADAATNYEAAWQKKSSKKEFIFKAAEAYFKVKDYRKAAEAYGHVKEENKDFPLAGLRYCRALKMDGQYDEASRAFVYFINGYNGDDKDVVSNIVQDEIRGCELGMAMLEKETEGINFEHLSDNVNSKAADFAPVPFSDDVLYYTSNMVGETKMYLTQRNGGVWSRSKVPKNFPKIEAPHFGNGAFSPDNKSFFYTQCGEVDATGRMVFNCQIYVTQREDSGWSAPEKLNSLVNRAKNTATQPYIVHEGNKEILYFVSGRTGGEGGMDIWYTTRELGTGKMDFSKPKNCGSTINTMADEMTPYFDVAENALYFSSNGNVNIGGFDVFKSTKSGENTWDKAVNIGLPYNSSADDYYFRKYNSTGGYVVSNRKFGLEKTTYRDDDIFGFSGSTQSLMASGKVMNKADGQAVENVMVNIYEVQEGGEIRLLENKSFADGTYNFGLLPEKNYSIEAIKEGYSGEVIQLSTMGNSTVSFVNDIVISKKERMATTIPTTTNSVATTPPVRTEASTKPTTGVANGTFNNPQPMNGMEEDEGFSSDSGEMEMPMTSPTSTVTTPPVRVNSNVTTTNSRPTPPANASNATAGEAGVIYKIQLLAVRKYNDREARFNAPKNYGYLETEYLPSRNLTRVLLSNFTSKQEANEVLRAMKNENRDFRTAVVVRYENGVRIDPWKK